MKVISIENYVKCAYEYGAFPAISLLSENENSGKRECYEITAFDPAFAYAIHLEKGDEIEISMTEKKVQKLHSKLKGIFYGKE